MLEKDEKECEGKMELRQIDRWVKAVAMNGRVGTNNGENDKCEMAYGATRFVLYVFNETNRCVI